MKAEKVYYGRVVMFRMFCPSCQETAFVIKGKMACCGVTPDMPSRAKTKRVSEAEWKRSRISEKLKKRILAQQENRCAYCDENITGRACFDHVVCWSYCGNNDESNLVAACNICNGIKSNLVFNTLEEARNYVIGKRGARREKDNSTVRLLQVRLPDNAPKAKVLRGELQGQIPQRKENGSSSVV